VVLIHIEFRLGIPEVIFLDNAGSDPIGTSPWSVKGVEPEAREAAKIAARRAGLTVGQWLSQTIRSAATEQLRSGGRAMAPPDSAAPANAASGTDGMTGHAAQPPAPTMQAIFESIQKLSSRLEADEAKTSAAIAPLADQVDHLAKQLDEVKERSGVSTAPIERAVMRLSERIQKVEQSATPPKRNSRWSLFGFSR
jgi:localization factor PodJL